MTAPNATNHHTPQDADSLSIAQLMAIDLFLTGITDQAVADAVGRHRRTVIGWRLYNPVFRAELIRRRRASWAGASDAFRVFIPMAMDTLRDQLRVGANRGRLALDVLYKTGLIGTPNDPVLSAATIDDAAEVDVLEEMLNAEVRRRRAAMALEDPDDPHLIPPSAPVNDIERQAALEYLTSLAPDAAEAP